MYTLPQIVDLRVLRPPKQYRLLLWLLLVHMNLMLIVYYSGQQPDTLTTKHREIEEELRWKVPSYWLSFILLRSTMQVDNKERSSIGLL